MTVAEIIFTGICALVLPSSGSSDPGLAILPNASGAAMPHVAFLLVEKRGDWQFTTDPADRRKTHVSDKGTEFWLVEFDRHPEILEVQESQDSTLEIDDSRLLYRRKPARKSDLRSTRWIPRMNDVWPGQHKLKDGVITPTSFDPSLVAARMTMRTGKLTSNPGGLIPTDGNPASVWRISPRGFQLPWERTVTQEVSYRLNVTNDLIIKAVDVTSGDTSTFTLHKLSGDSGTDKQPLRIVMGNTPRRDITPSTPPCNDPLPAGEACLLSGDTCPGTCIDHHFENYYDLFDAPDPARRPIPHRVEQYIPDVGLVNARVSGGNCPPLIIEP